MIENLRVREFSKDEARQLNPLQLALIGDGAYEIFIRNYILSNNTSLLANKMHREAIKFVKAKSQANIMYEIEDTLTEEELHIYKEEEIQNQLRFLKMQMLETIEWQQDLKH